MNHNPWTLAQRAHKMNPSVIREILKVTERPGIISFAGGLPSTETFPVDAFAKACEQVLHGHGLESGRASLQYAASEGFAPLREWVAASLPWAVDPAQVLITTGSQQGLDLVGKVLIDAGSRVLVETPTYLGALQAFSPMEPVIEGVASDEGGVDVAALLEQLGAGDDHPESLERRRLLTLDLDPASNPQAAPRFLYVLPNFQNPTGRSMDLARRQALVDAAARLGLPLVEDNPYGDLWFDQPPPTPLTALNPDGCIYLGSFSKILAPGLRLGFLVAPPSVYPKLLQAKQAADLHSPSFNQRVVAEVIKDGFLDRHIPTIRALYKRQCHAMLDALKTEMAGLDVQWNAPDGGMFLWVRLPEGMNAIELLPKAVAHNVAFVPGAAFYADHADPRTLRLSFVTANVEQIHTGIAALARAIRSSC
jgi:2-aminoadipate transaminase